MTESPRVIFSGQGPEPNCRRVEVDGSRVEHVWSGCSGGPAFFIGQGPGPDCRRVAVVGSRVKLVWSCMVRDEGFGTAEAVLFLCPNLGMQGRPFVVRGTVCREQRAFGAVVSPGNQIVGAGLPDGPPKISDFRNPAPTTQKGEQKRASPCGNAPTLSSYHCIQGMSIAT